jgi:hypothetical protein
MTPVPRDTDDESKKAIEEYIKNGGTVTVCPPNERTENIEYTGGFYQRRKKKKEAEEGNK